MAFPPRFLDELRQRVSLAEIVGRRVKLVRRGREYIGLCPFHKEKTPSFSVVEDKGFYHCFGCGAHGDVIGFVMQTENLSFPEAVEQLARQAGLDVPQESREERERAARQATLQGAVDAACVYFEQMLYGPDGRAARAYLERRGLDEATIRRFRLGYAPDGRDHLKRALAKEFPEPLLIEAGLLRKPEGGGETYDYFRDRVIFPIGDRRGRIIAFGGRVMGDGQPKYLNSPDTPLFQKGRVLYGWALARAAAAKEPSAIVVEGYMDVIALHRAGFATAVAPLGTALTEAQIEELWRLAPEPILCFDGDAAGQRAASRALARALPILKPGIQPALCRLAGRRGSRFAHPPSRGRGDARRVRSRAAAGGGAVEHRGGEAGGHARTTRGPRTAPRPAGAPDRRPQRPGALPELLPRASRREFRPAARADRRSARSGEPAGWPLPARSSAVRPAFRGPALARGGAGGRSRPAAASARGGAVRADP